MVPRGTLFKVLNRPVISFSAPFQNGADATRTTTPIPLRKSASEKRPTTTSPTPFQPQTKRINPPIHHHRKIKSKIKSKTKSIRIAVTYYQHNDLQPAQTIKLKKNTPTKQTTTQIFSARISEGEDYGIGGQRAGGGRGCPESLKVEPGGYPRAVARGGVTSFTSKDCQAIARARIKAHRIQDPCYSFVSMVDTGKRRAE